MRLVLFGPPAAGKGTQARFLSERLGIPHISVGNILRHEIELGTDLGLMAKKLIDKGNLVGDKIVNAIVHQRLELADAASGYIMDGYPRTLPQAEDYEKFLKTSKTPLTAVIDLEVNEEEIIRRLSGRLVCPECGATFHETSMPPLEPGKCDHCGSLLHHRDDDTPEAIRRRLQVYRLKTQPLIDFYRKRNLLIPIDARHGVERTLEAICQKLGMDDCSLEDV